MKISMAPTIPGICALPRQDTTWWTGRSSRSSRWIPYLSLISDLSDDFVTTVCVNFVRSVRLSWFKVYLDIRWLVLMVKTLSGRSFILEVSLATLAPILLSKRALVSLAVSLGCHSQLAPEAARPKAQSYLRKSKDIWSWNTAFSWKKYRSCWKDRFTLKDSNELQKGKL